MEFSENILYDKNENEIDSIDDLNSEDNYLINKEINSDIELIYIKDNKIEFYLYGFDFDKTSDFSKEILDFNNEIDKNEIMLEDINEELDELEIKSDEPILEKKVKKRKRKLKQKKNKKNY